MRVPQRRGWRVSLLIGTVAACCLTGGMVGRAQDATPVSATPAVDHAQLSGTIVADGSSTVWPITAAAAEDFVVVAPNVVADVNFSGTGGGFRRFCRGETDIQNASRPITPEEAAACEAAGVAYEAFPVAYDGITVTVNPANTWAQCLTVEQLRAIWEPGNPETSWKQVDPAWPDMEIELYGPGPDSGTFDYFTEAIVGEAGASRTDYVPSENDLDLVEGVASQPHAMGYFGFAYYEENAHRLRPVAIDGGSGCVLPSAQTIADGSYAPLSRPLYLYVNRASLPRPEVQAFLRYTLAHIADIVRTVQYVPLPTAEYAEHRTELEALLAATPVS